MPSESRPREIREKCAPAGRELDYSSILLLSGQEPRPASRPIEVKCLAPHVGPALLLFGLVRVALAMLVSGGLFYLLIKLQGLAHAMTKAKQTAHQSAGSQRQPASATAQDHLTRSGASRLSFFPQGASSGSHESFDSVGCFVDHIYWWQEHGPKMSRPIGLIES